MGYSLGAILCDMKEVVAAVNAELYVVAGQKIGPFYILLLNRMFHARSRAFEGSSSGVCRWGHSIVYDVLISVIIDMISGWLVVRPSPGTDCRHCLGLSL